MGRHGSDSDAQRRPGEIHPASSESRDASMDVVRIGLKARWSEDLYHRALRLSWARFLTVIGVVYFAANLFFAALYYAQPGSIVNARAGFFRDAFFFSVETFGTIGYGVLAPATDYANAVMTLETLCGITLVALTTGVMFARVSRPTARVLFSASAVVTTYEDRPTLMVRMGNARPSQILEAEVGISLLRNELSREGMAMRRFYALKLERSRTPAFTLSYTAMHVLDESSPLHGVAMDALQAMEAELLVTVSGVDETMSQIVHARRSYGPADLRFGHRFANIFGTTADGRRTIDYRRFHLTEEG